MNLDPDLGSTFVIGSWDHPDDIPWTWRIEVTDDVLAHTPDPVDLIDMAATLAADHGQTVCVGRSTVRSVHVVYGDGIPSVDALAPLMALAGHARR